jgi:uncharacterized SAM-binding protein YcdF (DUF218 family)
MEFNIGFILKKILSALLMPYTLGLVILAVGLWYLYRQKVKKAQWLMSFGFVWMILIAYSPIANTLLSPLENQYPKFEKNSYIDKNIEYVVLLGGDAYSRAWEVIRLYHLLPNIKIITTGDTIFEDISNAQKAYNLLTQSGIPKEAIIMLEKPKDTKEEVLAIKKFLGNKEFVLVTSAYHLPRAMGLFAARGVHPIPAPTDWKIESGDRATSIPNGKQLYKTQRAWHEYIGMVWSSIIDKL